MVNPLAHDLDHILDHTRELWEELRGERIFITGGTGFFGCWLLESFAWANDRLSLGAQAWVLTRNPLTFQKKVPHLSIHPAIHFHVGDIRTFKYLQGKFYATIHAAGESSEKLKQDDLLTMLDIIVSGTRRLLNFALFCEVEKILFTSSGAVYGPQPVDVTHIMEDSRWNDYPSVPDMQIVYRQSKRMAELLFTIYARQSKMITTIARCFSFVGPYLPLNSHFAIGNFIRDGISGSPIRISGDGTPYRSYLYAADLAIWLWTILLRGESCRSYNVGSDIEVTISELAHKVANSFNPQPQIQTACTPIPNKRPDRYIPSTKHAREELGLEVWIDLQEAISRTISWYSKDILTKKNMSVSSEVIR